MVKAAIHLSKDGPIVIRRKIDLVQSVGLYKARCFHQLPFST